MNLDETPGGGERQGEQIGQQLEGKSAEHGNNGREYSSQEKLFEDPAKSPVGVGDDAGNGSDDRRAKFGELRRQGARVRGGFPPVLQDLFDLRSFAF